MKRLMMYVFVGLFLSTVVSCSKKSKEDVDPNALMGSELSASAMTFNAQGSDSGQISGLATVNFAYDRASLTDSVRQTLSANADWMKSHPQLTVQIEGHCDDRGSAEYNISLGERRAKAVKNHLVSLGISPKQLTTISYGEEKPVQSGETDMARTANRRANFMPLQ